VGPPKVGVFVVYVVVFSLRNTIPTMTTPIKQPISSIVGQVQRQSVCSRNAQCKYLA